MVHRYLYLRKKMYLLKKMKEGDWSLKLFILVCLFAWSSWIDINGVFVELPLLVATSPQGWTLPSYLTVVIQLANIGPLIYLLLSKCCIYRGRKFVTEVPAIFFIIIVGITASCILSFTWLLTTNINGKPYSSALISLTFLLSTVDCMSSVVFLPFMAYFPQKYITAYYVGAGFSAFLPSIAALIQGIGGPSYTCQEKTVTNISVTNSHLNRSAEMQSVYMAEMIPIYHQSNPRFSVQVFFLFISAMLFVSLLAFALLVRIKNRLEWQSSSNNEEHLSANNETKEKNIELDIMYKNQNGRKVKMIENDDSVEVENLDVVNKTRFSLSFRSTLLLLIFNGVINGLSNGVVPALQSYACLPYGANIYHLTLSLSAAINPLACFFYFFISIKSVKAICFGCILYIATTAYVIGIAATSPCPLMNDSTAGGILMLIISVASVGIVSYLRTAISSVLQKKGHEVLLWCGVSTQVGSLIFALSMFPMISIYGIFKNSVPCQRCP